MGGFRKGQEVTLKVERLLSDGRGLGFIDGFRVFTPDGAPGDLVRVRLKRVKAGSAEAELLAVEEPSPLRVPPPCPSFGLCGGCAWQHVEYREQLRAKEAIVREALERIGLGDCQIHPILGDPSLLRLEAQDTAWSYRNKMEFTFASMELGTGLGLHRRGAFDRIVNIEACWLQSPLLNRILQEVRSFVVEHGLKPYDPRTRTGFLRHLVLREGKRTGEVMVGIITAPGDFPQAEPLARLLASHYPEVRSVLWGVNPSPSDAIRIDTLHLLYGRPWIYEELAGLRFKIDLTTFFQTNTSQAERLVEVVKGFAALGGREVVVDLYSGVGTFALALAPSALKVYGIEVVASAVKRAWENGELNGINNVEFRVGEVRKALPDLVNEIGSPDLVVLDPPRAGAGTTVMRKIARAGPKRVIYVSCNPAPLAVDLQELCAHGYRVQEVQPLDLFPQTVHMEVVVVVDRIASRPRLHEVRQVPNPDPEEAKRCTKSMDGYYRAW